jgi:predicted dehydrogenase
MKRRQFLSSTAAATTAAVASLASPRAAWASDRVRVGLIGCGGRGRFVAWHMREVPGVEFVAVCDVYEPNRERAREWVGQHCRAHKDFRDLLDQADVDAVLIATPDHWHAIPTVLACEAGKDVYVEKPLAHNIREQQVMLRAAQQHNRIVQVGTQQRSAAHFERAAEFVQSGALGRVHLVRIWNYRNMYPQGIGTQPDSNPPPGLDWDFYVGPAPRVPFNRNRFLGSFRWFWDYSGGVVTDWGTHRFDSMHQVMGVDAPLSVSAIGGRFALDDGGEVPDVQQVTYEYPGFIVSYECTVLNAHGVGGRSPDMEYYRAHGPTDRPNGLAFYGTNGALFADRLGFEIYPELKRGAAPGVDRMQRETASSPDSTYRHCEDFIECVRSRKRPRAHIGIGHRSSVVAHLGNIAYRTGHKIRWDAEREEIADDREASAMLGREGRRPWNII